MPPAPIRSLIDGITAALPALAFVGWAMANGGLSEDALPSVAASTRAEQCAGLAQDHQELTWIDAADAVFRRLLSA